MTDAPRFGTVFGSMMGTTSFDGTEWSVHTLEPVGPLPLHPATHTLHYASACFEGLKAHRAPDGSVHVFRLDRHMERLAESARRLLLPAPDPAMAAELVIATVGAVLEEIPKPPGSLYLRPTLIGTDHDIGAAGSPSKTALFFVLPSPVGDYFAGGVQPLRIAVETKRPRTTPQFGSVKSGANYAMAVAITNEARETYDAKQVLFMPDGLLNETGASNVLLLSEDRVVTPPLDGSFLAGVTRDSVLTLAAESGLVVEERPIALEELVEWSAGNEVALTGTAAVVAPVGTLVVDGADVTVGDGQPGPVTMRMREILVDVQTGRSESHPDWRTSVGPM